MSCSSLIYSIRVVVVDSDSPIVNEVRFIESIIINDLLLDGSNFIISLLLDDPFESSSLTFLDLPARSSS
jgi:hypothetical protein